MKTKILRPIAALVTLSSLIGTAACSSSTSGQSGSDIVISYNSPKTWGNFGEVLSDFTASTGISAPNDPKNSGQALAALQAEKGSPVADTVYVGIAFANQLVDAGVLEAYTPKNSSSVPSSLKSPQGYWTTVHTGTVAFIVNKDALAGTKAPTSWADLLQPEYKDKVGYLNPTQAAVGYSVATAANLAMGGTLNNWDPGLQYLKKLKDNGAVTPAQTATAQVSSGEIPILIDTDFDGYNLKDQGANIDVVIPQEGSLQMPYVVGLVKNAPHADNGKKLLDFYFSDKGQQLFAKGYMRPVIAQDSASTKSAVLPDSDYARAKTVDFTAMGAQQTTFSDLYKKEVLGQ